jgi:signal transduction histidine kinase
MQSFVYHISRFCLLWVISIQFIQAQTLRSPAPNTVDENLRISAEKEQEGDYRTASDFLNRAAMIESEKKNFAKAAEYYEKSIRLNEKVGNESGIAGINSNLAMLYNDMGQYEKALIYFQKTLETRKQRKEREGIFDAMFNVAIVLKNLNRDEEAIEYLENALKFSSENYDLIKMRLCYGTLYELYQKKDDPKKMAYYYSFFMDFNNRIYNKETRKLKNEVVVAENRSREIELEKKIALLEKEKELKAKEFELDQVTKDKKIYFSKLTEDQKFIQFLEQEKKVLAQEKELKEAEVYKEKSQKEVVERESRHKSNLLYFGLLTLLVLTGLLVFAFILNLARKRANRLLKEKQVDLTQANRVKDKMFSIIAHDLRAPFNGIKGLLTLLDRDLLDEQERQDLIRQLRGVTDSTLETLENLLRWAKGQMQGVKPNPVALDLNFITENSLQLLSESARQKNIILSNLLPMQARVVADADHLDIIIRNLVSNAIKFTPKDGWVSISAKLVKDDTLWRVEVRDSGVGIPAEKLHLLFDNDKHFSTRGTNNEKGTGLGLILVKELLQKNGGDLKVESKVNFGTTFYFTLPAEIKKVLPEKITEPTPALV